MGDARPVWRWSWGSLAVAVAVLAGSAWPDRGRAESWCADPLYVHEWGVHTFGPQAGARSGGPSLPPYFHARAGQASATGPAVRALPPDNGIRELPVVHFYAGRNWRPVPLGLEVGFAHGRATRWYPQVDAVSPVDAANGQAAARERSGLLTARGARQPMGGGALRPLGRDPTRQLHWDALTLDAQPQHPRVATPVAWVDRLRGFDSALWVNGAHESERFVFYDGQTSETPAISVSHGPSYRADHRHLILRNTSGDDVHDVFFVHREGDRRFVFVAPSIPAGRTAGFVIEEHAVPGAGWTAATRDALRARLVDSAQPAPPTETRWNPCTMMRDPAIPTEAATDHRLYAHEVDAILELWGARLFDATGTTIVYRESTAALDREMPISLYTDMFHSIELRRLGLAIVEGVTP